MNVLLIGGGGREHALAWALKKSKRVKKLYCAPGNAGIAALAECLPLDSQDRDAVLRFIKEKKINFTVIGPEAPLVDGLADAIRGLGGQVFGPGAMAARLEGSKVFAKNFMKSCGIPTAGFETFSDAEDARAHVDSPAWNPAYRVVKASGLAAGKGVLICRDKAEVLAAIDAAMVKKSFGAAGELVVLEEMLEGEELSVLALCDGNSLLPLAPSQDHKRAFDNDEGPNTGGMGAYAPVPQLAAATWSRIEREVFAPFLQGISDQGLDYRGVIYFGLMLTAQGPKALEFNVRFGDPETQVVVPLVENDWMDLFEATVDRKLAGVKLAMTPGFAITVVLAAGGYPGAFQKGKPIAGLDQAAAQKDVFVFHAGTSRAPGGPVATAGGRVLAVTALGPDLESARARAYAAVDMIKFEGAQYRRDIAARALKTGV